MKRLFFVFLLLLALAPVARSAGFLCIPNTAMTPTAEGSKIRSVVTNAGKADGYWCPTGTADHQTWTRQELIVLNKYAATPSDILRRVVASPDFLTAINAELAVAVVPVRGSMDEYDYKTLQYQLCLSLISKPYLVEMVDPVPKFCGSQPKPPVSSYSTPAGGVSYTIYKVVDGKIASVVSGKKASVGATCDCSTSIVSGSSTYCGLLGGIVGEVTQCVKVK